MLYLCKCFPENRNYWFSKFCYMKRILITIPCVLLLVSCSGKTGMTEEQEKVASDICGQYGLWMAIWGNKENNDIDVDGDGHATNDLWWGQLRNLPYTFLETSQDNLFAEVSLQCDPSEIIGDANGIVSIDLPIQYIIKSRSPEGKPIYQTPGGRLPVNIHFTLSRDGTLRVEHYEGGSDEPVNVLDIEYINDGNLEFLGGNTVSFTVNCMYYDYATEQIVTGPVEFIYKKYL